jgi:hypothetical protein
MERKWVTVLLWGIAILCVIVSFSYNLARGAQPDESAILQIKLTDDQIKKVKEKYPGMEIRGKWLDFSAFMKMEEREKEAIQKPKAVKGSAPEPPKYRMVNRKQQRAVGAVRKK